MRSGSSFSRRWKRRVSTSFIMPKSSPGVRSRSPVMLNLRYWLFTKPSGPATIIAADRIGALDVAVVVDLDPLRRRVQIEGLGQPFQQPRLGGALAILRARLSRALRSGVLAPVPPSRPAAARRAPPCGPARSASACAIRSLVLDPVAEQDQPRRHLVVVELRRGRLRAPRASSAPRRCGDRSRGCPSSGCARMKKTCTQACPPSRCSAIDIGLGRRRSG